MTCFDDSIWSLLSEDEGDEHYSLYEYDEDEGEEEEPRWEESRWEGLYHNNFPNQWRETHLPGTGPEECSNCAHFGSVNGLFIGYCANCADYEYNGTRGRGFIDIGVEHITEETLGFQSVFDTYLFEVELDLPVLPFNEEGEENENLTDEDIYGPNTGSDDSMWAMPHYENGYNDY
jgi:hypothetical protein